MNLKLFETDLFINKIGSTRFEALNNIPSLSPSPSPPNSQTTDDHSSLTQLSLSKSFLQVQEDEHRSILEEQQCPDDGELIKSSKKVGIDEVNKEKKRGKNGIHTKVCARGHWRPAEDAKLKELVTQFGPQNWNLIAQNLAGRSGKSCRLRWFNQLDPRINKRAFTEEEEERLLAAHNAYGNKWAVIARLFPGRTDNAVKNHWHVIMARRTREQQQQQEQHSNSSSVKPKMTNLPPNPNHEVGGVMRDNHVILLKHDDDDDQEGEKKMMVMNRFVDGGCGDHHHHHESMMTISNDDESAASTCTYITDLSLSTPTSFSVHKSTLWLSNNALASAGEDQYSGKEIARAETGNFGSMRDHQYHNNGESESLNSEISADGNSLVRATVIEMMQIKEKKKKKKKKKKTGSPSFFDFLGVGAS